jgi:hypothetical protein
MRVNGLVGVHKPAKVRTTIPAEDAPPLPDLVGRRFDPGRPDVAWEPGSYATTLVTNVDTQTSEQGNRLGMAASPLAHPCRRLRDLDAGHAPGVAGDRHVRVRRGHHQHPCRPGAGGLASMAAQPLGLLGGPALEPVELVPPEQDRWPIGTGHSEVNGEGRSAATFVARSPGRGCAPASCPGLNHDEFESTIDTDRCSVVGRPAGVRRRP